MGKLREYLQGRKAYIVGTLLVLVGVVQLITGDITLNEFASSEGLKLILEGFGLGALRAAIAKK